MKTEFTAKYLQHLSKKNKDGGFTLIELLVVIIIVGVLAAIALPSFLNQIGKARGSEAKSSLGTINRSQQAYRLENNTMASAIGLLDARINQDGFYSYAVNAIDANNADAISTTRQADLRAYSAYVSQSGDTFQQVICESNDTVAINTANAQPTNSGACGAAGREIN